MPRETIGEIECPPIGRVRIRIKSVASSRNFKMWADSPTSAVLTKPARAPIAEAMDFVRANLGWLAGALQKAVAPTPLWEYLEKNPKIELEESNLQVWLKPTSASGFFVRTKTELGIVYEEGAKKESVEKLFRDFARGEIGREITKISGQVGLGFSKISVRDQRGRWASRSSSGGLSFNWRIMLLPLELRKYIYFHELAHVRFMNHSTEFWIFLNRLYPQARRKDAQLKTHTQIIGVG